MQAQIKRKPVKITPDWFSGAADRGRTGTPFRGEGF